MMRVLPIAIGLASSLPYEFPRIGLPEGTGGGAE